MLPTFLGIGAHRCGTTWLYANLKQHPQVWLTPIKEVHYFDKLDLPLFKNRSYFKNLRRRTRDLAVSLIKLDTKTIREISWDVNFFFRKRNNDWYVSIFQPNHNQIAGEITPGYNMLTEQAVRDIYRLTPALKVIFLLRDPIERSWSHAVKDLGRNKNKKITDLSQESVIGHFEREETMILSDYIHTLDIWTSVFGKAQIHIDYMEEIQQDPRAVYFRLCRFLEISEEEKFLPKGLNKIINSNNVYKTEIPRWAQIYLARKHLAMLEQLSPRLGGYATLWLKKAQDILSL